MKTKIHTLQPERDFKLIGIASHLSPHKISWLLNEGLGAKFQQSESLLVKEKNSSESIKFPTYKFEDEGDSLFTFYANKVERTLLQKSIKGIDYIIKYEGVQAERMIDLYIEKIKSLKNILTAFEIDLEQLKNKELDLFC